MEDLLDYLEDWVELARVRDWTPEEIEKLRVALEQLPSLKLVYPHPDPVYQAGYAHASGYHD